MKGDITRIARRELPLSPLVPESEMNVPEPLRAEVPAYLSYEVLSCDDAKCQLTTLAEAVSF